MRELACLLACWFDGRKRLLSIADAAKCAIGQCGNAGGACAPSLAAVGAEELLLLGGGWW